MSMRYIKQDIFPQSEQFLKEIPVRTALASDAVFYLTNKSPSLESSVLPIGISCYLSPQGDVEFIALANVGQVFIVRIDSLKRVGKMDKSLAPILFSGEVNAAGSGQDSEKVKICLLGFSLASIAVQTSEATRLQVKGVDIASAFSPDTWKPPPPAEIILKYVSSAADRWKILSRFLNSKEDDVCLRAWLSACVGSKYIDMLQTAQKVDTSVVSLEERCFLAEMATQAYLLDEGRPKETQNDFTSFSETAQGHYQLVNSRFKSRVRPSNQTRVVIKDKSGRDLLGNAIRAKGKSTTIKMNRAHGDFSAVSIKVVGHQEPTNPERSRNELIFLILIGKKSLRNAPFIRTVWFPHWPCNIKFDRPEFCIDPATTDSLISSMNLNLNNSQQSAVCGIVGSGSFVITHGPPGTGKTTTIAAAARIWALFHYPVWIVAHSNVAVKNIAYTLHKNGVDFKLLVSKEFYHEWHEHIYVEVENKIIRSDELPKDKIGMERLVGGSLVMLSTLSMLSNPALFDNNTFSVIPMERLVIDEASQINRIEFLHIFDKFKTTLQKVCFFGDPEQLPPFGKDKIPSMKTIFDVQHISNSQNDFFLDTQYRMPVTIGCFISNAVYKGRLKSQHSVQGFSCVAFIDASRGEESKMGFSWKNEGEINTIVNLIKYYYRKSFSIVTPYDAQRAAIQRQLESENLPSNSVYNLDSFQGNEDDYIIISVVRTNKPGFLTERKRMNVLLTRCRKAMIIATSRQFMRKGGSQTLLGSLSVEWENKSPWIDWKDVATGVADLPGALGPNRRKIPYSNGVDLNATYPTQKRQYVPRQYQGKSGGFSVSSLFQKTASTPQIPPMPAFEQYKSNFPTWEKDTHILYNRLSASDNPTPEPKFANSYSPRPAFKQYESNFSTPENNLNLYNQLNPQPTVATPYYANPLVQASSPQRSKANNSGQSSRCYSPNIDFPELNEPYKPPVLQGSWRSPLPNKTSRGRTVADYHKSTGKNAKLDTTNRFKVFAVAHPLI